MSGFNLIEVISIILIAVLVVLLLFAFLAPLDSLRWWDRRSGDAVGQVVVLPEDRDHLPRHHDSSAFLVYLSGVAAITGTYDNEAERAFLADLADAAPTVTVAADVFAYSVDNQGLTQRGTAWFWGKLADWQRHSRSRVKTSLSGLVQVRNIMRVMVSADRRYGPPFNLGVAQQVVDSLGRHGYDWKRKPPVVLLGYSGGGQVALGAAWYLNALDIDVTVISIAGVLNSDPGISRLTHLWHFYGSRDGTRHLGATVFPGRWPVAVTSNWNQARRDGRVTVRCLGPMKHAEGRDYFDAVATDADGVPLRTLTLNAVTEVLAGVTDRARS